MLRISHWAFAFPAVCSVHIPPFTSLSCVFPTRLPLRRPSFFLAVTHESTLFGFFLSLPLPLSLPRQSVALALKPHVVIATPGRLVDHLENTKGFSLRTAKYLVLDEADRMLGMVKETELLRVVCPSLAPGL